MINSSRVHSSTALRFFCKGDLCAVPEAHSKATTAPSAPSPHTVGFDGDPAIMVAYLDCVGVGSSGMCVGTPLACFLHVSPSL